MRAARIFTPLLVALTAAACARQQASYVVDRATDRPVPAVQSYAPYGQQSDAAPQAYTDKQVQQSSGRGLFTSHDGPAARQQRTPAYAQSYAQQASSHRGVVRQQASGRGYVMQYYAPHTAKAYASAAYHAYDSYGRYGASRDYGAYSYAPAHQAYTLGPGDKVRVVVFGQQGISGSYLVDAAGNISLPLVGSVKAHGHTTQQLASLIADRLKQGYVRDPHVTVDMEAYRPFFILGEVTTPGQYPYVPDMTVENAIAIAGGFAPRANKHAIQLTRNADGRHYRGDVPQSYPLRPGDTLVVKERWF